MNTEIQNFIPVSFIETDKYIKDAYGNFIIEKRTEEAQIKMQDNKGKSFIHRLYNLLLETDLCDRTFTQYNVNEFGA